MAVTTPDNIRTPNSGDQYALTQDLGVLADSTQAALVKRANSYTGTSAQRAAFTSAPEGVLWVDTNGAKMVWQRVGGVWVAPNMVEDTGWVNCTLVSGITQQGTSLPRVRRIGEAVYMRWGVSGTGLGPSVNREAFTIPAGFRPGGSHYVTIGSNLAAASGISEITGSGLATIRTSPTAGSYYMWDGISYLRNG